MTVVEDFRAQYPGAYDDLSDAQLAQAIRKKYYADMPAQDFYRKAGLADLVGLSEKDANGLGTDSQNFGASAGKAVYDTGRGLAEAALALPAAVQRNIPDFAKQYLPDALNADTYYQQLKQGQTEANQRDAALMHTKAGIAGYIAGNVGLGLLGGSAAKAAGVAGRILPAGYRSAAATGAAFGAVQPIASDQTELSRLGNAGIGAAAGVAGQGAANLVGAAYRGGKSLLAPFFSSGQDQIAANTLSRFGGDAATRAVPSQVPGVNATLTEQTGNAGIAQLQRAVQDKEPTIAAMFAEQAEGNNAARLGLLQQIAGTNADVVAAKASRDQLAQAKYGQAFTDFNSQQLAREQNAAATLAQGQADAASKFWPDEAAKAIGDAESKAASILAPSKKMQELASRPVIQAAAKQAKVIAANAGVDIGDPVSTLQGQHYIKMALDDALNTGPQIGIGKAELSAISSAKKEFVSELERQNPAYREARQAFAQGSGPVNRLEVAQGLLNSVTKNPADIDSLGNQILRPDAFGRAVGNLDQIAQKVTKQRNASAASLLSPQQQEGIQSLLGDLSRVKVAQNVGKSAGSNTVQNLASQNLLSETASGLGLPGLADSGLLGTALRPLDALYKLFGTNDAIKSKLAGVLANPQAPESQAIIARMTQKQRSALADYAAGLSGLIGQSSSLGIRQQPALER